VHHHEELAMTNYPRRGTSTLLLAVVACLVSSKAETPPPAPVHRAPLKQRMKDGEACRGAFLGLLAGGPAAQFLAGQGFDFFILDLEHYTFDEATVREMIIAARGAGIAPILRVGEPNQQVTRWLGIGAEGIVIPTAESRAQAEALVRYARYRPLGERGASSINGHTNFARVPDLPRFLEQRNRDILLFVMIETPKGLERADGILATPGIDGAILGTGDSSQAIGLAGQPDHPEVWKAAERLIAICRRQQKLVSVPIRRPEHVRHWVDAGLNLLTFVDLALVSQGIQLKFAEIEKARGGKPGQPRP
jgi:2-keto-3-deoxy-L-rhamnonate aldolase RhmA